MAIRERIGRILMGTKDPATGRRSGGVAEAFRGGNGQTMSNPISAMGDRIGRNVAGRINDWRTDRLENRHRRDLINAEMATRPSKPPPILGTPDTKPVVDRPLMAYNGDPRSILNPRNQQHDPMAQIDRGPVSQFRDLSAVTRRGGESATDRARNRAAQVIAERGLMNRANIIQ